MKKNNDFKRLLLNLEDETFFYIIRNYLGPLQTPFHKPTLIKDLIKFLSIKSVQEKILLYIDTLDKKILTAVFLLPQPAIQDIYQLFHDEYEFFQLQQTIINLEERLLLITVESSTQLQINPLFKEMISKYVVDISMLLGSHKTYISEEVLETPCSAEFLLKPVFLPSLLTFYFHNKFSIFPDGKFKKKTEENILQFLGNKNQEDLFLQACFLANHALFSLGILQQKNSEIVLNDKILFEKFSLDTKIMQHLTPVHIFVLSLISVFTLPVSKPAIKVITSFLLLVNLVSEFGFRKEDIRRLFCAANLLNKTSLQLKIDEKSLIDLLVSHNIFLSKKIQMNQNDVEQLYFINPSMKPLLNSHFSADRKHTINDSDHSHLNSRSPVSERILMTMDSDYSIIIDPETPISSFITICPFIELRKIDNKYLFELTKKSFLKAIDSGKTLNQFVTANKILAKREIPSHILSSLESWLDVYNRIEIYYGIIIKSDPLLSRIIETHPDINKYVIEKLSDRIFLMDRKNEIIWRGLLTNAGIDFLPTTKSVNSAIQDIQEHDFASSADEHETDYFSEDYIDILTDLNLILPAVSNKTANFDLPANKLIPDKEIETAKNILSEKLTAMSFPEKDYEEFCARIEKKLILVPQQLRGSPLHRTIWEAKGLDYQGKLSLCKNALKNGNDLLEIHMRKIDGSEIITLLRAVSLENSGKDALLKGIIVPEETEAEFVIRKIFLLRKLKSSLFSP